LVIDVPERRGLARKNSEATAALAPAFFYAFQTLKGMSRRQQKRL